MLDDAAAGALIVSLLGARSRRDYWKQLAESSRLAQCRDDPHARRLIEMINFNADDDKSEDVRIRKGHAYALGSKTTFAFDRREGSGIAPAPADEVSQKLPIANRDSVHGIAWVIDRASGASIR